MTITILAVAAVLVAFFGWAVVRGGAIGEQQQQRNLREVVLAEGIYDEVDQ